MSDSFIAAIGYDNRKEGADQFVRDSERIIDAQKGVETTTVRIVESTARQMRSIDALARKYDPLSQTVREHTRNLEKLTRVALGEGEVAERAASLKVFAQARLTEAQAEQAASLTRLTAAQTEAIRTADEYKAAIDPITAAYERTGAKMKEIMALERSGLLTAEQRNAAISLEVTSLREKVAVLDGSAAATKKAALAEAELTAQAKAFLAVANPQAAAAEKLAQQRSIADKLLETGKITTAEYRAGLDAMGASTVMVANKTNQTSNALRQMGIQSIDVFQQLASGAPVLTTFVQQGGQLGQVMATTGTSIGAVTRAIGAFIAANAGVIAATAGMAAFGIAAYAVLQRASDLEAQQRTLSVAITGVGRSAELSSAQLQGYINQLKQQGVAAEEAQASVLALARNPGLSGGAIARIVGLAPDAAAASGQSVQDATRLMSEAMKGAVDAVQKLDETFNLLTAAEAASIRVMLEHGDKGRALETVFGKLSERVSGLNRDALSPMEQTFRDLGNAWSTFMDRIAKSETVMKAVQLFAATVRALTPAGPLDAESRLSQAQGNVLNYQFMLADPKLHVRQRQSIQAALDEQLREVTALEAVAGNAAAFKMPNTDMTPPSAVSSRALAELAASRVAGSDEGRIASLTAETGKFRAALKGLDPAVEGNRALINDYTRAIAANEKAIAELNKKNETHRTGLEKAGDTLGAQIKAQRDLAAAYGTNDQAVRRVLATQEAEKKAISDGLVPGTAKYAAEVARLTVRYEELADATGSSTIAKTIAETDQATEAQKRITAAYDGTSQSLEQAQAQEKAHAAAVKALILPGMAEYEDTVSRLSDSYLRSSDAAKEFQHIQSSVNAVLDMAVSAADRVGQALVDATFNGAKGFANLGTIAKGVGISMLTDFAKLGLINPITNSFGGQQRPSLWTGVSALAGAGGATDAGGGSNLFGTASNLFSIGRATDALGITGFGDQAASLGNWLGLTGDGGLFSGVGSGIGSFLSTGINGVAGGTAATNAALANMGGAFGPASSSQILAAQGGATIGGALAGIGGGFALGSLTGGFVQSALNKTGPGPTIGAGVGSLAGFGVGTLLGGPILGAVLGGLLGGAGGGLIGPRPATPFSATGLTKDDSGLLSVGRTFSQIVDTTAEVNALQQQVSALNALLSGSGARIANAVSADEYGQARLIGGNSGQWLNFGQGDGRPGDLNAAFGELRFTGDNQYLSRGLAGQSFATAEALQTAATDILNFVNTTAPALKALVETTPSFGVGTLAATIDGLSRQFDDAKVMAEKLGFAEYDLTEARTKAIQIANDNATKQLTDINRSFLARTTAARGVITGSTQMQLDAALLNFDIAAEQQRDQFRNTLLQTYGDAFAQTQAFADQLAAQETAINAERLASSKSYLDAIAAAEKQSQAEMERAAGTAANAITPIIDYVRNLRFGPESVVPANDRYTAASSQFSEAIAAAQAGDATSVRNLTGFAETFRAASRAQYGSGTQFVTDVGRIVSALEGFAGQSPETLTNAFYASEVRTQTATLGGELKRLVQEVAGLRSDMRTAASVPASRAA